MRPCPSLAVFIYWPSSFRQKSHLWIVCASTCCGAHTVTALCILECTLFAHFLCLDLPKLREEGKKRKGLSEKASMFMTEWMLEMIEQHVPFVLFLWEVIATKKKKTTTSPLLITVPPLCGPGCRFKCYEQYLFSWTWRNCLKLHAQPSLVESHLRSWRKPSKRPFSGTRCMIQFRFWSKNNNTLDGCKDTAGMVLLTFNLPEISAPSVEYCSLCDLSILWHSELC